MGRLGCAIAWVGRLGLAGLAVLGLSGCGTVGYYAQSVGGHLSLLRAARPVAEVVADPSTPAVLRDRLILTQRMRDFAVVELKLPDNASYRRYADLKRSAAVWNVVAAPELSLTLRTWCFAVVGCIGYRGYFDRAAADAEAAALQQQGDEVSVYGVPAYSTLGSLPGRWFADPLLNTIVQYREGEVARMIFHELAHQVAYAKGDTTFNESFATAVERIGGDRWLAERSTPAASDELATTDARQAAFRSLTTDYRDRLAALYARTDLSDADKRLAKVAVMQQLRVDYADLKQHDWNGYAGYDSWFARANNASFGLLTAYNGLVPQFVALFEREGRDFDRFYAEARRLASLPQAERRAQLASEAG